MKPIISISDFRTLQLDPNCLCVDARGGAEAYPGYLQEHLSGAIFVDLENELSCKQSEAKDGGRHPLPSPEQFCVTLANLGVTDQTKIVVYDDKRGANAAARFWWMVRAIGHLQIAVLDGGLEEARKQGVELGTGQVPRQPVAFRYEARAWSWPIASLSQVEVASRTGDALIVDVREGFRFRGESEPIDLVAGHIPGAINIPYAENLAVDGCLLDAASLQNKYSQVLRDAPAGQAIVHCGSGVSACHTILAMEVAGLPLPRLYVGSWSEWSRNELPIAKS